MSALVARMLSVFLRHGEAVNDAENHKHSWIDDATQDAEPKNSGKSPSR